VVVIRETDDSNLPHRETSRSARESEAIIDNLKQVVDRLTYENEHLKSSTKTSSKSKEQAAKAQLYLTEKIAALESEIRELRSREAISKELQSKLRVVIEDNDGKRHKIEELHDKLYAEEDKFRTLLLQHDMTKIENEKLRKVLDELKAPPAPAVTQASGTTAGFLSSYKR
jgi:small-conductance mechanosensitive channel